MPIAHARHTAGCARLLGYESGSWAVPEQQQQEDTHQSSLSQYLAADGHADAAQLRYVPIYMNI